MIDLWTGDYSADRFTQMAARFTDLARSRVQGEHTPRPEAVKLAREMAGMLPLPEISEIILPQQQD